MIVLKIEAAQLSAMFKQAAISLNDHKQTVNKLNVFPIPDGDTGDNMYMTAASAVKKATNCPEDSNISILASSLSEGALLGARGNSGVILSQIIKGICECMIGVETIDANTVRTSLKNGVDRGYNAVPKPVEGTILTVMKDAANAACRYTGDNIAEILRIFCEEAENSVKRTPDLLPVLKEAGVVDSGGAGLFYLAKGMEKCMESGFSVENPEISYAENASETDLDFSLFTEDSELQFGYCTEFILRLQNKKVDIDNFFVNEIIDYLNSVGDSVVAFKDGSIVKVHVHTKNPGEILSHCQRWGEYLKVKIENMTLQHHGAPEVEDNFSIERKKFASVVVASGDGMTAMFKEAGADAVISGGQTMNPSTSDFIDAFDKVNAQTIFVFPNNGNIIMTASQAAQMYDKSDVRVIPTKDVGQGYISVASLDNGMTADEIESCLKEVASSVNTGLVSKAIRNCNQNGLEITDGSFIGINGHNILSCSPTVQETVEDLCEKMNAGDYDVLLLIAGEDADDALAGKVCDVLSKRFPRTETILQRGNQKVFDFIIVLQ